MRIAREYIGLNVILASFPMNFGAVFFNVKTPAKHLLRSNVGICQVGMVGPNIDSGAKENRAESSKGFNNRQELFLYRCVIALCAG